MTAARIRVVVADDHELVRAGFTIVLESEPGIEVVGQAADGAGAIEAVRRLDPDVVCMDVQMPGLDGLAATRAITRAPGSRAAVLILTTFDRDDYLFEALEAGASGFLLKNTSPERLIEAVRVLAGGDALLAPDVTRRVIERFAAAPSVAAPPHQHTIAADGLTARELEVLRLLADGLSNTEIAGRLGIGEATVKTHVSRVLMKLGVRDRIQAVVYAYRTGLVPAGG